MDLTSGERRGTSIKERARRGGEREPRIRRRVEGGGLLESGGFVRENWVSLEVVRVRRMEVVKLLHCKFRPFNLKVGSGEDLDSESSS